MLPTKVDLEHRFSEPSDTPTGPSILEVRSVNMQTGATFVEQRTLDWEPYLPDPDLVEIVNLAITLRRPLLLQGDPGCGKTRLAYALAYGLGWPLEECYIKSTSRAQDLLYTYDAIGRLYDAQLGADGPADPHNPTDKKCRDPRNYVLPGPLGQAIARAALGQPSVVLIDEIDKADIDFPNDLLRELDRMEFVIPEANLRYDAGPIKAHWPLVVVTHNEEKALPSAFLRRCIFHVLRFPDNPHQVERILALHGVAGPELVQKGIVIYQELRKLHFVKSPGLSELLDWLRFHGVQGTDPKTLDQLPAVGALLKQQGDLERASREWPERRPS